MFRTRTNPANPHSEVGGYIFNNRTSDDTWTSWQQDEEETTIRNVSEETRVKAGYASDRANLTLEAYQ